MSNVPYDKKQHFVAGFLIAGLVWFVLDRFAVFYAPALGIVSGIVAGLLKEIWDGRRGGKFDAADFGFTFLGSIVAVAGSKLAYAFYMAW